MPSPCNAVLRGILLAIAAAAVVLSDSSLSAEVPGYWIGLHCQPVSSELREQMGLEPGLGLVVEQVIPDSPAAKAGLKTADVIFALGDHPLNKTDQLAEAVSKTKGSVLKLQLLRKGQPQTVEVKPAARPAEVRVFEVREGHEQQDKVLVQLRSQLEKPHPPMTNLAPGRIIVGASQPGAVFTFGTPQRLPDNMTVTISRKGQEPATIVVEQGAKMWKTTEKETEMLPAEARAYVARFFGGHAVFGTGGAMFGASGHMPGAHDAGKMQHFELRLEGMGTKSDPALTKNPAVKKPDGKVAPKEGTRLELKESDKKNPAPVPPVKWQELKRPESPPKTNLEHELRELEEQILSIRKQVEQLRALPGQKR